MGSYDGMWENRLRIAGFPENPIGLEQLIRSEREAKERARELKDLKKLFEDERLPLTVDGIRSFLKGKSRAEEELRDSRKEVDKLKEEVTELKSALGRFKVALKQTDIRRDAGVQVMRVLAKELGYDLD
jgi:chromosome segregation ATPase